MSENSGADYVAKMREKGLEDEEIKAKMLAAGWNSIEVNQAFTPPDPDAPPPPPSRQTAMAGAFPDSKPLAVVENLSTRGIEYAIMFIALGIGAFNLGAVLHLMVASAFDPHASGESVQSYAFPATAALVTIPIFLILFSRLKAAESEDPALRKDASRRKWVQFTLLGSFLIGIGNIIMAIYALFTANTISRYSDSSTSYDFGALIFQQILHLSITLAIAGSIFFYWWHDEHKKDEPEV
jgi:hypothetical protein